MGEETELLMSLRQKEFAVLDDVRGAEMQALILEARERQDSIGGSIECMALNLRLVWANHFLIHWKASGTCAVFYSGGKGAGVWYGLRFLPQHRFTG